MTATLTVDNLKIAIGDTIVLRGAGLEVQPGEVRGLVGESGAGKSMLGRAALGLLPSNASIVSGSIAFEGRDLLKMSEGERRRELGRRIALIPQDPMTSLNPVKRVAAQIGRLLRHHLKLSKHAALERAALVGRFPEQPRRPTIPACRLHAGDLDGPQRVREGAGEEGQEVGRRGHARLAFPKRSKVTRWLGTSIASQRRFGRAVPA